MAKNTDKQAFENISDNFRGYAQATGTDSPAKGDLCCQ